MAVRQRWATICTQNALRGFLARRALRVLKGLVRLQAIVRVRQVRKQADVTLRCMQAPVRVQTCIRTIAPIMAPTVMRSGRLTKMEMATTSDELGLYYRIFLFPSRALFSCSCSSLDFRDFCLVNRLFQT